MQQSSCIDNTVSWYLEVILTLTIVISQQEIHIRISEPPWRTYEFIRIQILTRLSRYGIWPVVAWCEMERIFNKRHKYNAIIIKYNELAQWIVFYDVLIWFCGLLSHVSYHLISYDIHRHRSPLGFCNIVYPYEIHLELNSRKISSVLNIHFSCSII